MSQDQNEKKIVLPQINVSIDNAEVERMRQELENMRSEKEMLEENLKIIAEKELSAKCDKYGIDESLDNETKIEKVKDAEIAASKGMTGFTSDMLQGGNSQPKTRVKNEGYDNVVEMGLAINRQANNSDDIAEKTEAEAILTEFGKLSLKSIKTHGRENFSADIDPADLKKLREESKRDIAKKRLKR